MRGLAMNAEVHVSEIVAMSHIVRARNNVEGVYVSIFPGLANELLGESRMSGCKTGNFHATVRGGL